MQTATKDGITVTSLKAPQEEVNQIVGIKPEGQEIEQKEEEEVEEQKVEGEEDPDKPNKGKGGFQRRIDKLTARSHRLETENAEHLREKQELRSRLESIEKKLSGEPAKVQEKAADGKPDAEQFAKENKTYEDYLEALAKWTVKQERDAKQREDTENSDKQRTQKVFDDYNSKLKDARVKYEDFDEQLSQPDVQIPAVAQVAIMEMDNGPDVAYHLATHPEIREQLLKLNETSTVRVVAELGHISKVLAGEKKEAVAKPEKPAPVQTLSGGGTQSSTPLDKMSYRDFQKARAAGRTV